eukprot:15342411-Ditylum_brightwellii.AAC.1
MVTEASETQPVSYDQKHQSSAPYPFWTICFTHTIPQNDISGKFMYSTKVKSLLVKLYAAHGKDMINIFSETKRCLEVEMFPKMAKEVKDLLDYETINGQYKNVTMILHVTGFIPFAQFENRVFNWLSPTTYS